MPGGFLEIDELNKKYYDMELKGRDGQRKDGKEHGIKDENDKFGTKGCADGLYFG